MTYEDLKSFQQAKTIYDLTVEFCNLYIDKKSRTHDQMVQAARSGKQNIAEGSAQSQQKPKSEIYLLSIASASLKELLEDYQDFLRQQNLSQWGKDDARAVGVRQLAYKSNKTDKIDRTDMTNKPNKTDKPYKPYTTYKSYKTDKTNKSYKPYLAKPEPAANMMISLINQTTFLLDQQIRAVGKQMEQKGINLESHNQKLSRISQERQRKNEKFDRKLKELLEGKRENLDDD